MYPIRYRQWITNKALRGANIVQLAAEYGPSLRTIAEWLHMARCNPYYASSGFTPEEEQYFGQMAKEFCRLRDVQSKTGGRT